MSAPEEPSYCARCGATWHDGETSCWRCRGESDGRAARPEGGRSVEEKKDAREPLNVCAHWAQSYRQLPSPAELGRVTLVVLDQRMSTTESSRMLLCPACTEGMRHWLMSVSTP